MAKINILFNGTEYAIDEANLAPATNALKAHLETLGGGGGTLEFGTDWKFKDVITPEDFEAFFSHCYDSVSEEDTPQIVVSLNEGEVAEFSVMKTDYSVVYGGDYGVAYTLMYMAGGESAPSVGFANTSLLTEAGKELLNKETGWFAIGGVAGTTPTIPNVPEDAVVKISGGDVESLTPEYLAPLFDIPGTSGDLPITLDGAVYKVDSTKLEPATNSLIAHLETLKGGEGGGLVEGGTYTFKNNLSGIDPADFMKTQVGSGPLDGQQYAIAMLGNYAITYLTAYACDYMYMRDEYTGTCPNGAWDVMDTASQVSYLYPITIHNPETGETIDNPGKWLYAEYRNTSSIKEVDPLSVTIPAPFDASFGYSLDEIAVFFDIPTSGNSGDTKITINGVDYFVDSAKLADATNALHTAFEALQSGGTN